MKKRLKATLGLRLVNLLEKEDTTKPNGNLMPEKLNLYSRSSILKLKYTSKSSGHGVPVQVPSTWSFPQIQSSLCFEVGEQRVTNHTIWRLLELAAFLLAGMLF